MVHLYIIIKMRMIFLRFFLLTLLLSSISSMAGAFSSTATTTRRINNKVITLSTSKSSSYRKTTTTTNFQPLFSSSSSSSPLQNDNNDDDDNNENVVASTKILKSNENNNMRQLRQVEYVEKFARLPVWPVWMGIIIFVISRVFGNTIASKVEDAVGGRVCPNFFDQDTQATSSPFIMLVHHRHTFWNLDLIRWIQQKFILPEGFPSHPHRGFTTLTYFLKGGFIHRDSLGIQQHYGANNNNNNDDDGDGFFHHSQWLFTGAGLLHEEMFDESTNQELFQLWINVPSYQKLQPPHVELLGPNECPVVISGDGSCETIVLAGSYDNNNDVVENDDDDGAISISKSTSKAPIMSDMSIFHVKINQSNGIWEYKLPTNFDTVIIYVRQGSIIIGDNTQVDVHHTAYLERGNGNGNGNGNDGNNNNNLLVVKEATSGNNNNNSKADFILLAGQPLNEPVSAQGSMVMNFQNEINLAYQDYSYGKMGKPWSHKLSNEQWKLHVQKFPCQYQYDEYE